MDEDEIEIADIESLEACLDRALEITLGDIGVPDLRGEKDLASRHTAGAEPCADADLVLIHRGGIDVAITDVYRLRNESRRCFVIECPGSKPDSGDVRAVRSQVVH